MKEGAFRPCKKGKEGNVSAVRSLLHRRDETPRTNRDLVSECACIIRVTWKFYFLKFNLKRIINYYISILQIKNCNLIVSCNIRSERDTFARPFTCSTVCQRSLKQRRESDVFLTNCDPCEPKIDSLSKEISKFCLFPYCIPRMRMEQISHCLLNA